MNFKRSVVSNAAGTSLAGYVDVSYGRLVEVFGEPDEGSCDFKTDAEWIIEFDDGLIATIYNYKDGKAYCGDAGMLTERITNWHIGGRSPIVVDRIQSLVKR